MKHPPETRPRWQQVEERWGRGESVRQIAEALGISTSEVHNQHNTSQAHAARCGYTEQIGRARLARKMAAVYDNPKARAWILKQMGVEE
jgi:FixJ family two-component response regulator